MDTNPEIGLSIDVDGITTNYHRAGSGPVVLLVHGSGPGVSAWANWRLTIPALAEHFTVIAPDIVGFGFTDRPEGFDYSLDTWRAHLLGFADALGLDRFSIVGNSFGGALALSMAAHQPERVDRLVLMGAAGGAVPHHRRARPGLGLRAVAGDDAWAARRLRVRPGLRHRRARPGCGTRPPCDRASRSPSPRCSPAPRQRWVDALATPEDVISALPHRTLVVHGRDDQVIPLANAHRLLELIDDSQLHVFGRCGHWTQIEHADEFNALVARFLR
jgi:2-hydroxymuconate-semialdehyde hydrolase